MIFLDARELADITQLSRFLTNLFAGVILLIVIIGIVLIFYHFHRKDKKHAYYVNRCDFERARRKVPKNVRLIPVDDINEYKESKKDIVFI